MKPLPLLRLSLGILFGLLTSSEDQDPSRLEASFKAIGQFEYGKDAAPLNYVESLVIGSHSQPSLQNDLEQRMSNALMADGTRDGKEFICRQLSLIGSSNSVPALQTLLTDPGLSHMARFALVRIPDASALAALRWGLTGTSGVLKAGIINSLGARKDTASRTALIALLQDKDQLVVRATAAALGDVGGAEAVQAINSAKPGATEALRLALNDSLLRIADSLQAGGNNREAGLIYQPLLDRTNRNPVRVSALRGMIQSRPEAAPQLLRDALTDADALLRACAVELSKGTPGDEVTRTLASLLEKVPPDTGTLILAALATRPGDEAGRAISQAAQSADLGFRIAAYRAMGKSGQASYALLLLAAASKSSGPEREAAEGSLLQLTHPDVAKMLIQELSSKDTNRVMLAVKTLGARREKEAFAPLLSLAENAPQRIRGPVIHALAEITTEKNFSEFLRVCLQQRNPAEISSALEQLQVPLGGIPSAERRASLLLAAYSNADPASKGLLLPYLANTGQPAALALIRESLKSSDADIAQEALRALADWPDPSPAEELLAAAQGAKSTRDRVVALRGYVRMAGMSTNSSAMFVRAMELAKRPDDKKAVLGSLGSTGPAEALGIIEPFLDDPQLKLEAATAIVQIANRSRQTDASRLGAALRKAAAATQENSVHDQAVEALNAFTQYEGHILKWLVAGPYQEKDKDAHGIFNVCFAPEQPGTPVKWDRLTRGIGAWDIILNDSLSPTDDVAAYLRTQVWSPMARPARLELGSDDGIKVWLNGELVHTNDTERALAPRQDLVKVNLKPSWNVLLLKVLNREGGWAASCRIRQPDGAAMDDLKYEAK